MMCWINDELIKSNYPPVLMNESQIYHLKTCKNIINKIKDREIILRLIYLFCIIFYQYFFVNHHLLVAKIVDICYNGGKNGKEYKICRKKQAKI